MRIAVVTTGDAGRDPGMRYLARSLHGVGHDVITVDGGTGAVEWPGSAIRVPSRLPLGPGLVARTARSIQPRSLRAAGYHRRLGHALRDAHPALVYPMSRRALEIALQADGAALVAARPSWGEPLERDIAAVAPYEERWSISPAGPGVPHHLPGVHVEGSIAPDRFRGTTIVAAYRQTATTPGRYLTAAMERAGIEVIRVGARLDWGEVPDRTAAVIAVESPLPPVEIHGDRKPIPFVFWVHHGEHHLDTNLRLLARYGADAVLLAHSWHLAHRFPVPVHRFPFGVATELYAEPAPFAERRWDVAMVGAGLHHGGGRYSRRAELAAALRDTFGDRAHFPDRVSPEELAAIYGSAKVVINEGGDRHRPITMRVFEAIGGGAALLSDDLPGMAVLFARGEEYEVIGADPVAQVAALARGGAPLAAAGRRRAYAEHTYDHRVNELLAIAPRVAPRAKRTPASILDPDVDSLVVGAGASDAEAEQGDRIVWAHTSLGSRRVDAALVTPSDGADDIGEMVAAARRFVYAVGDRDLDAIVAAHHPAAVRSQIAGGVARYDLEPGTGYRQGDVGH